MTECKIPDGFKIVPIEATSDMIDAYFNSKCHTCTPEQATAKSYKNMVEAAPKFNFIGIWPHERIDLFNNMKRALEIAVTVLECSKLETEGIDSETKKEFDHIIASVLVQADQSLLSAKQHQFENASTQGKDE